MAKFWRKKAIMAALESTYGSDANPTGAANAMLVINLNITPLEGQDLEREIEQPHLGSRPSVIINKQVSLTFEVEMAGAGTAGDLPPYDPLLRACGFAVTQTPGTDATYTPVSEAFESVTIYVNIDGVLHKLLGARGTVDLRIEANNFGRMAFSFTALYAQPVDQALPTVDTTAFQTPQEVSTVNTSFSFGSYSGVLSSANLDIANAVTGRFLVGQSEVIITDRAPAGQLQIDAVALADYDIYQLAAARTLQPLTLTQGTAAGGIVELSVPRMEVGRPSYSQDNNIVQWSMPYRALPSDAGNDECAIVVR